MTTSEMVQYLYRGLIRHHRPEDARQIARKLAGDFGTDATRAKFRQWADRCRQDFDDICRTARAEW